MRGSGPDRLTQVEIEEAADAIERGELDILDFLTKKGAKRLTRYMESLIDAAARGNTWDAETHARQVVLLVYGGSRSGRRKTS